MSIYRTLRTKLRRIQDFDSNKNAKTNNLKTKCIKYFTFLENGSLLTKKRKTDKVLNLDQKTLNTFFEIP